MNLRPVNDRIIVRRDPPLGEEKRGNIIIPESAQERPQSATVIAVGTGLYETRIVDGKDTLIYTHVPVAVGDRIILGKYSGAEWEDLTIIGPQDILAVIEE